MPGALRELTLDLGDEVEAFRTELRAWLQEHVPSQQPDPRDLGAVFAFQREWQRALHAHGWVGITWPREHGGRGAGPVEQYVYYEELARSGAPRLLSQPAIVLVGPTLMVHGSVALQARHLRRMLAAEDVWCQGFSEPGAGSDLAGLRTRARLDGDHYVLDGQKTWTTWAPYADLCAVLCRTDPAQSRHRGLSLIVVDLHQPGVTVRPIVQLTGQAEFGEIFLDGARAPRDAVIGEPGDGWAAAMTMLEFERSDPGFTDHARLLHRLEAVATRVRGGAAVGRGRHDEQELWRRLARLWVRCQVLRRLNLDAAQRLARGERIGDRGSVIKLYWSELYQAIGDLTGEVAGLGGLLEDEWTLTYLESRAASIYSGTSEIQRTIIGERVAGLPRG